MGHHDGAVPVNRHKGPCQGPGDDRGVDEARVGVVAEGEGREVEEVDDQDKLGPAKVGAGEEHDEGKVQEVVQDEVRAYCGGGIDLFDVGREEMQNIADLQDEQDDEVDVDKREVESKAGWVEIVLAGEGSTVLEVIGRRLC